MTCAPGSALFQKIREGRGGVGAEGGGGHAAFMGKTSGLDGEFECAPHGHGIRHGGNGGVDEDGIRAELHGLGGVRGGAKAGVNNDGDGGLLDDDADEITGAQSQIAPDGRPEGHDGGGTGALKVPGENGIGVNVGKDDEAVADKLFAGAKGFDGIRHEPLRVGMNFELEPGRVEGFAGHAGGKDGLAGGVRAGSVGKELVTGAVEMVQDGVGGLAKLDALDGNGDNLGAGGVEAGGHLGAGGVFSGAGKETALKFVPGNAQGGGWGGHGGGLSCQWVGRHQCHPCGWRERRGFASGAWRAWRPEG